IVVQVLVEIRRKRLIHGCDPNGASLHERAAVGLFPAQGDPQERRLARPVAADQTDLLTRVVLPGHIPQHLLGPIGLANVLETIKHGRILSSPAFSSDAPYCHPESVTLLSHPERSEGSTLVISRGSRSLVAPLLGMTAGRACSAQFL